jgi:hypothetical protein
MEDSNKRGSRGVVETTGASVLYRGAFAVTAVRSGATIGIISRGDISGVPVVPYLWRGYDSDGYQPIRRIMS